MIIEFLIPIYMTDFVLCIGDEAELSAHRKECAEAVEAIQQEYGGGITMHHSKNALCCILLRAEPQDAVSRGTLAHEVFHAASYILESRGIKHRRKTEEVYAYLVGYITEGIYTLYEREKANDSNGAIQIDGGEPKAHSDKSGRTLEQQDAQHIAGVGNETHTGGCTGGCCWSTLASPETRCDKRLGDGNCRRSDSATPSEEQTDYEYISDTDSI